MKALANSSDKPQRKSTRTRSGQTAAVDMERELQEKDLLIEQLRGDLANEKAERHQRQCSEFVETAERAASAAAIAEERATAYLEDVRGLQAVLEREHTEAELAVLRAVNKPYAEHQDSLKAVRAQFDNERRKMDEWMCNVKDKSRNEKERLLERIAILEGRAPSSRLYEKGVAGSRVLGQSLGVAGLELGIGTTRTICSAGTYPSNGTE